MQLIFNAILKILEVVEDKKFECLLFTLICFAINVIAYPQGAINQFMVHVVDVTFLVLPSTPEDWKLASILADFAASNPHIGWGILWEIIQVPLGLLMMFLGVKVIQFVKP